MKVFVTGATGFTGSRTVPLLLARGWEVHCLYRESSDRSVLPQTEIHWHLGNLENQQKLTEAMQGCDMLVNIASLGFGHAENIVKSAQAAGIQRAIFISTTAIFTKLNSQSKRTRLAAEAAIQNSDLNYTILRPTMIYGSQRDRNMYPIDTSVATISADPNLWKRKLFATASLCRRCSECHPPMSGPAQNDW